MARQQNTEASQSPGLSNVILAAAIMMAAAVVWMASGCGTRNVIMRSNVTSEQFPTTQLTTSSGGCAATPVFVRYVPSTWEQEWINRAEDYQNDPALGCRTLLEESRRSETWLAVTGPPSGSNLSVRYESSYSQGVLDSTIFSSLVYRSPCSGEEYQAYIEPLVGHFRHPYAIPPCKPPGKPDADIQSRDYVLFGGLSKEQFDKAYPGRKFLFNLGTANFQSSIPWFLQRLQDYGHAFDEIWAWEVQFQDPKSYWASVPDKVVNTLHFYNVPVANQEDINSNPLNIIRKKYQPGDYVFMKLDIDNSPLELSFIDQIASDARLISMISEMSFEMHYYSPYMEPWFGKPDKKWIDVIHAMASLRHKGLKIHYWP